VALPGGQPVRAVIAGQARYFPTLDPTITPFVLLNLATLARASGSPGPGELWIKAVADPGVVADILRRIRAAPRNVFDSDSLRRPVSSAADPLQAGLYGIVSLGFLSALGLAVVGLLIYAGLALIQRGPELAVVRTLGLSAAQVLGLLMGEQVVLVAWGLLAGGVSGTLAALLFIPYLPLARATLPPFVGALPATALADFMALVATVLVLVVLAELWSLRRVRLAQVLRLGQV